MLRQCLRTRKGRLSDRLYMEWFLCDAFREWKAATSMRLQANRQGGPPCPVYGVPTTAHFVWNKTQRRADMARGALAPEPGAGQSRTRLPCSTPESSRRAEGKWGRPEDNDRAPGKSPLGYPTIPRRGGCEEPWLGRGGAMAWSRRSHGGVAPLMVRLRAVRRHRAAARPLRIAR